MPEDKKNLPAKKDGKKDGKKAPVKAKKERKSITRVFKDTIAELKKVTWPSRKELITYTTVVLVFVLVFSAVVGVIDLGLGSLYKLAFGG